MSGPAQRGFGVISDERRMDAGFAVFNLHVNRAGDRADKEFIRQFGETLWSRHIKPHHDEGIMTIFDRHPNIYISAWVALVTAFVNEGRARRTGR